MARSFLKGKNFPKLYWAEVVLCSVYILNKCPTRSFRKKTPEEVWSGCKPSVYGFWVFGCIAYTHVADEKRKKFDDKGEKYFFAGYSSCTNGL